MSESVDFEAETNKYLKTIEADGGVDLVLHDAPVGFVATKESLSAYWPTGSSSLTDHEAVALFAVLGAYLCIVADRSEDEPPR